MHCCKIGANAIQDSFKQSLSNFEQTSGLDAMANQNHESGQAQGKTYGENFDSAESARKIEGLYVGVVLVADWNFPTARIAPSWISRVA
jgi:hypothetical protein